MEISLTEAYCRQDRADPRANLGRPAKPAKAPAPSPAPRPRPAPPAAEPARCARPRASSRSSGPARPVRAAARSFPIPARACGGQGRVTRERTSRSTFRPASRTAPASGLPSEGEAGLRGGPPGDLYIFLSVRPHEFFQRDGADLFCKVPISMTAAALGGEIEVPTIDGKKARVDDSRRRPDRQAVPPEGQGHAGAALAQSGDHVYPGDG